ncbi:gem-associated protein 7-like [Venturia canescens]|uniref:gem-associated protein 7-like n=1 Tax=Venturia canescens TaxID=32260 RepID=UPI001C9CD025|nr:gem-associated protein 7-like [Venturia canescens]
MPAGHARFNFDKHKMIEKEQECEKLTDEIVEQDFAKPERQEARAFLRERFLRVITGIVGKPAEFNLHENSKVSGEFRGCDVDGLEVYVRDLDTPLGKVPEAILRTTDIIHFTVKNICPQQ